MTYPLLSRSNILNATEKLDSGMLSSVTKKMYLVWETNTEIILKTEVLWIILQMYSSIDSSCANAILST